MQSPDRDPDPAWPWDQPPNAGAITCRAVLAGAPILHVSHDGDDHGWQFLDGRDHGDDQDTSEARIIGMRHVLELRFGARPARRTRRLDRMARVGRASLEATTALLNARTGIGSAIAIPLGVLGSLVLRFNAPRHP